MEAIVYTSKTGNAKRYAEFISKELNLPFYDLKEAKKNLKKNDEIIYVGWLCAGTIKGYVQAFNRYTINNIVAVGMTVSDGQTISLYKTNKIPSDAYVLNVKGNLYIDKLSFVYKIAMKIMKKVVVKKLGEKEHLTADEQDALDSINNTKDFVDEKSLLPLYKRLHNKK